ncbi:MAG: hypothetical protein JNM81_05650 [Rhodospirillaceae bacterium]|nr:hypothetical protein [Rhodospirillaceae bacterium]
MLDEPKLDYVRELPGFERGHPHYFKDPMIDHLLEIVMLLGGELWVTRDRQMIVEHLLATEGKVTPDMIERFQPSPELRAQMDESRKLFTQRVFNCLYSQHEATQPRAFFEAHVGKS